MCKDLANKNTKLIITNPDWGFGANMQFMYTCPILEKYILDNYVVVKKYGSYWIYVPKKSTDNTIYLFSNYYTISANIPQPYYRFQVLDISNEQKLAMFEHPYTYPSNITFGNLSIPLNATIKFSIAMDPAVWSSDKGDGVTYEIYASDDISKRLLFSEYLDPKHNTDEQKWNDYNVSLSDYSGKRISLIFVTTPGPNNNSIYDWAYWGDPVISTN
jgi:hypothetical protein